MGAGITCTIQGAPLALSISIAYANLNGGNFLNGTLGKCSWTYSDGAGPGTGTIHPDPMLDATYHLQPVSPCRNAGDPGVTGGVDFDGDIRPQEGRADIGADEVVP